MDKIKIERTWLQGSPVQVDNLMGNAFVGEAGAHEFLISGKDNAGNVVPITGTITGKFLSSTMTTFALSGYVTEGVASVTLPSECYGAPGQFVVSIFATNGSTTTCIYCGVGSIFRTSTAAIAYPTTTLPDLTLLINQLEDTIASFPADLSHLLGAIAPTFVDNQPFYAGQYVWNNQVLYRFTVDHPAGSWAGSADTVVAVLGTELNSTVRYTQQVLTDAQKTVARTNIDAAAADDVVDLELTTVQVTPQTFDGNSKSQARSNIEAASSGDLSALSTLVNNQGGYISDLNASIGNVPTGETVEGQITDLKSAIDNIQNQLYTTQSVNASYVSGARGATGAISANSKRCTTQTVWNLKRGDTVSLSGNADGQKYAFAGTDGTTFIVDGGWQTTDKVYVVSTDGMYFVNVTTVNGTDDLLPSAVTLVATITDNSSRLSITEKYVQDLDITVTRNDIIVTQNLDSIRKAFPASTNLFNVDDPNIIVGRYISNTGESAAYAYINTSGFIPVEPSTAYCIASDQNNYPRYISEYDSTKTLIPNSGASNANITTTANTAYIRFSYRNDSTNWRMTKGATKQPFEPYYIDYIKTDDTLTDEYLPANAKAVGDTIESLGFDKVEYTADDALNLTWTEGYVDKGGSSYGAASYHYSNHIPVSEGDVLYTNGSKTLRFVCAYDAAGQAVTASGAESVIRYTVPSGVSEVVVSILTTYTGEVRHEYNTEQFVSSNGAFGYFKASGDLSDGDALTLPITNIDKNVRQVFTADITSFSSVLIGRKSGNNGYWVVIDATNITVYRDNVASTPIPHGLTIQNNLQIRIITKHNVSIPNELYNADITVTSNGIDFTAQDIEWRRTYNLPVVQSVGSVLTDCVMSWESGDVGKSIYMFGDSYFSWGVDRWAYYCAKDGFDENGLFNAYPGENSANAIIALRNVVPLGKPKYLVWCLGMNDGSDSESAPSSAWVTGRDAVINLCERYGITPVFATIPTVPTINHERKNAWVRSSGYRYIDFAKAVGAQSDGTWYSGMLYTDGVHPTVQGAKALYGRVLTDFPEIMVNN